MPFPDPIPVRYTEEEAEYMNIRPVVRQPFRPRELVDMILAVTGKDTQRIRQILHSGTLVFHNYRYWWPGFTPDDASLESLLREFPDADPARIFSSAACTAVLLDMGGHLPQRPVEWTRKFLEQRRWLARRTLWNSLAALAAHKPPLYLSYSYEFRADLYALAPAEDERARLTQDALRLLPHRARSQAPLLLRAVRLLFLQPR
jgi:hypothetical protein